LTIKEGYPTNQNLKTNQLEPQETHPLEDSYINHDVLSLFSLSAPVVGTLSGNLSTVSISRVSEISKLRDYNTKFQVTHISTEPRNPSLDRATSRTRLKSLI